ncbi:MAG: hypothetical protein WD052_09060 [Bacteroidales bacterium]
MGIYFYRGTAWDAGKEKWLMFYDIPASKSPWVGVKIFVIDQDYVLLEEIPIG